MINVLLFMGTFLLALALGVSFSHLLQLPTKAKLSGETFLQVQQVLLANYGVVVGAVEVAAVLVLFATLWRMRREPAAARFVGLALACVVAMILVWAVWINPINETVNGWTPDTLPAGWELLRDRWAWLHVVRFALAGTGLAALLVAVLRKRLA